MREDKQSDPVLLAKEFGLYLEHSRKPQFTTVEETGWKMGEAQKWGGRYYFGMLGLELGNTEKMPISPSLPSSLSCTMENLFHKEIPVVRNTRQKRFDMCKFLLLIKIIFLSLLTLLTGLLVFNKYQRFKLHTQENLKSLFPWLLTLYHLPLY